MKKTTINGVFTLLGKDSAIMSAAEIRWPQFVFVCLFLLYSPVPKAHADVASDHSFSQKVYFYFFNGTTLLRMTCPDTVIVRDRIVCNKEPFQVTTFEKLRDELEADIGAGIPAIQTRIEQRYTRIQQIDLLIIEHLADVDDLADEIARLRTEMIRREGDLADLKAIETETRLQIAAIDDQIRQQPDPDLYLLLEDLKKKLADNALDIDHASHELAIVRERFITANAGIITDDNFRSLVAQRRNHIDALDHDRLALDSILIDVASLRQVFSFVLRPLVTYDIIRSEPGYKDIKRQIGRFEQKFAAFAEASLNTELSIVDSKITTHRKRISDLQSEHAGEIRLRTTLEQGVSHTFFDKIAVEVSPQGGGQGTVVFEDVILRKGTIGSSDGEIDKMTIDLNNVTEGKFSSFLSKSRCVTFFTSELPQMVKVAAALQARNRIGTGYIFRTTNGNGWDCDLLVDVATSWKTYLGKGGHTRSRQVAQFHHANLALVRTVQLELNELLNQRRELVRRLGVLDGDQDN